jgi:hypothetical protein
MRHVGGPMRTFAPGPEYVKYYEDGNDEDQGT